jgi:hypothetical protein
VSCVKWRWQSVLRSKFAFAIFFFPFFTLVAVGSAAWLAGGTLLAAVETAMHRRSKHMGRSWTGPRALVCEPK